MRLIVVCLVVTWAACGGGAGPTPVAPAFLEILTPHSDVTSFRGGRIAIDVRSADEEADARVRLVADRDGDPVTTDDQVAIAADLPVGARTAEWSVVGVEAGSYRIVGFLTNATGATTTASSTGRVTVVDLPEPRRFGGADSEIEARLATFADGSTVLTGYGQQRAFLVRYDEASQVLWEREIHCPGFVVIRDVAPYDDGGCVVVGVATAPATFGPGEPGETTLAPSGVFVARYRDDGRLRWVRGGTTAGAGTLLSLTRFGVATLPDGSCIAAGGFLDELTFAGATPVSSEGGIDIFVARFDADGTLAWLRRDGGTEDDGVGDVDGYPDGSCVVAGNTTLGAVFGTGEPNETVASNPHGLAMGEAEGFVARYGDGGALEWFRVFGGPSRDLAFGVLADGAGGCVVTGDFRFEMTLGAGEPNETTIEATGFQAYVARFSAAGELAWARSTAQSTTSAGSQLATAPGGSFYLAVATDPRSTVSFDVGGPRERLFDAPQTTGGFVAVFGNDGRFLDAWMTGARIDDVASFPDGSVVAAGSFRSDVVVQLEGQERAFVSAGEFDLYLVWFRPHQ